MDSPPKGPNLPAPRRTSAEVLKERLGETPAAQRESDVLLSHGRRRKSDASDPVNLALRVGGLEVKVSDHTNQIAALLASDSRTEALLTSVAHKVDDLASKMTVDKSNHERTQELLTSTQAQLQELTTDKQERQQHERQVKEALDKAERAAHEEREEAKRRIASYAKRGLAGLGALILTVMPSAINTAPEDLHQYLYPALGVAVSLFIFLGIPAVFWQDRRKP